MQPLQLNQVGTDAFLEDKPAYLSTKFYVRINFIFTQDTAALQKQWGIYASTNLTFWMQVQTN